MSSEVTILVIDDDKTTRETLVDMIQTMGHRAIAASTGKEGTRLLEDKSVDYVLTDLVLPEMDGLEVLNVIREKYPDIPVALITGNETIETCQAAIRQGAWDYLVKPVDLNLFRASIERALRMRSLYLERNKLRDQLTEQDISEMMVSQSPRTQKIFDTVRQIAKTDCSVLITGESGTGKEVVANAIHALSSRHHKPMIKVNLAALPRDMIESELFGHEKGAFTGAIKTKKGRFELADGGTLFLDEVAEMPPSVQVKLLRVLQEQEFERVGAEETRKTDIRLITATNKNLQERIKKEEFREDLYFRINVVVLDLPPLRDRKEDMPGLVKQFLETLNAKFNRKVEISNNAFSKLLAYHWPGNIRELQNMVERLCVTAPDDMVNVKDLPPEIQGLEPGREDLLIQPGMTMEEMEKRLIQTTLKNCNNNKSKAAKAMGIGLKTLYRKLEKFNIE